MKKFIKYIILTVLTISFTTIFIFTVVLFSSLHINDCKVCDFKARGLTAVSMHCESLTDTAELKLYTKDKCIDKAKVYFTSSLANEIYKRTGLKITLRNIASPNNMISSTAGEESDTLYGNIFLKNLESEQYYTIKYNNNLDAYAVVNNLYVYIDSDVPGILTMGYDESIDIQLDSISESRVFISAYEWYINVRGTGQNFKITLIDDKTFRISGDKDSILNINISGYSKQGEYINEEIESIQIGIGLTLVMEDGTCKIYEDNKEN